MGQIAPFLVLAGPYCTQLLGDLGAEVIKIENPRGGDDTRAWGPPFAPNKDPKDTSPRESAYFLGVNRNKKSITVNLRSGQGRQLVHDLVKKVDVLVENYVPGKLDEMGLGYKELAELNPKLIYTSITGTHFISDAKKILWHFFFWLPNFFFFLGLFLTT